MIARLLAWSMRRPVIAFALAAGAICGVLSLAGMPLEALPDSSAHVVAVRVSGPDLSPQQLHDQVAFPASAWLRSLRGVVRVRSQTIAGDTFLTVEFERSVPVAVARAAVLEGMVQLQGRLPGQATWQLGPDAYNSGWVLEYVLTDPTGKHDLQQLRYMQDTTVKLRLSSVSGVAEVASIGGMQREFLVLLDPLRMRAAGLSFDALSRVVAGAGLELAGGAMEVGDAGTPVRVRAPVNTPADLAALPLRPSAAARPLRLGDIAQIQMGAAPRQGLAELDAQGEVVGGIVVARTGANAAAVIHSVRERLREIAQTLPAGVSLQVVYDQSGFVARAVRNVALTVVEEIAVVVIVCGLFLAYVRTALVLALFIPLGVLMALLGMRAQGLSASVMSLAGIAVAVGVMVDAAIVMVENAHRRLEEARAAMGGAVMEAVASRAVVLAALQEVAPALLVSLAIIVLSFLPVLAFNGAEAPLVGAIAYTKTYIMLAAMVLSVLLLPPLTAWALVHGGNIELRNPLNRRLVAFYLRLLNGVLDRPRAVLASAAALLLVMLALVWPTQWEYLPPVDEGDLLYMPTALPGLDLSQARQLLQYTNRRMLAVPEVVRVFGKAGRSDSVTDPAPTEMLETIVVLKPRRQWRSGLTSAALIAELDSAVRVPGVANFWVAPIRGRIAMSSWGTRTPLAIRVTGPDLQTAQRLAVQVEATARAQSAVASAASDRMAMGRYVDIEIDRVKAASLGLTPGQVATAAAGLIGGAVVAEIRDGRAIIPIRLRLPPDQRDSIAELQNVPLVGDGGGVALLRDVAGIRSTTGPAAVHAEDGELAVDVYVQAKPGQAGLAMAQLRAALPGGIASGLAGRATLPAGYRIELTGEALNASAVVERSLAIGLAVIVVCCLLLYWFYGNWLDVSLAFVVLPFALLGGLVALRSLGMGLSLTSLLGLIGTVGIALEFAIVMLLYLRQSWELAARPGSAPDWSALRAAVCHGAAIRLRPKIMTLLAIMLSLLLIVINNGDGSEITRSLAAPMLGGMIAAPLATLLLLPVMFEHSRRRRQIPAAS